MTSVLDYADSVLTLERQAIAQADQGNRAGLKAAADSLRAIVADCEAALKLPNLSEDDRKWFEAKRDKAAGAMA